MSRNWPTVDEIMATVDELLETIVDRLDERDRYDALCARYLLDVGRRELAVGKVLDAQELRELQSFTGESGSLEELHKNLGQSIRAGRYDEQWQQVFELVLAHVVNNVSVSRPDQLEPHHRKAKESTQDSS